ncbi:MAG: SRPBCC domain-containing protein [Devosia sp.]
MQKPVVEVDTTIAADPKTVWSAMTAKGKSALFAGTNVDTDWTVGHPITFSGDWKGKAFKDRGEIQSFKAGEELSFTHWSEMGGEADKPENYHLVRYVLKPSGKQTKVTLSQLNMGDKPAIDAKTKAEFAKNWSVMLDGLKQAVEKH